MELAKVNLRILTERVNKRLKTKHDEPYMSKVRGGIGGSASLQDVCRQEEARMLREAADSKAES
ncbi:MAG: hypothetical protein ABI036_14170 [Fibrobacteria bacterium]